MLLLRERGRAAACFLCAAVFVLLTIAAAHAQTVTIDFGQLFGSSLREVIVTVAGSLAAAFAGWIAETLRRKYNIEIEQKHQATFQSAVQNAAGLLVQRAGGLIPALKINVGDPLLATTVQQAVNSAPDAVKALGITPDIVRDKILSKLGLLAAASVTTNGNGVHEPVPAAPAPAAPAAPQG